MKAVKSYKNKMKIVEMLLIASSLLLCSDLAFSADKKKKTNVLDELKLKEGDEQLNEIKSVKTELMVSRSELKAIDQAKKLIKKYKGTNLEPELQFRLAELYMRRAKSARFFEISRQSETVVRVAPKSVANASSRLQIQSAIDTYEYIQSKYSKFKQIDLVIFNNAFARQQINQEKQAEKLYLHLVKNYPQSALVPDSYLAIGEINFDRGHFSVALENFKAIRKFPESKVYPYGVYKSAWAHYNLREPLEGLKKLEEVVAYGKFVAERKIESRLDLRKEALADMTVFYEDVLPSKEAFSYFKKQAGDIDVGPMILKLARLYEVHSRHVDQQIVLQEFLNNISDSPYVVSVHGQLIWAYDAIKKKDQSVKQMEKLAELCQDNNSWLKNQRTLALAQKEPDPKIACLETLSEASLKLASRWLKVWKKDPKTTVDYADAAERSYEIYLRESSASQEASEARYAYAELLFQRQKFRKASAEYSIVSNSQTLPLQLKHDSSYAAVLSFEKATGDKISDEDEKLFFDLSQKYVKENPKGQYRLDVEFKMALVAYEKNRYDEAGPLFLRLGKEFGNNEKGKKSQDLYLDILNLKKNYLALKDYSKDLMLKEDNAVRKLKLLKIHEQAYFLLVQSYEEAKEFKKAIEGYKQFVVDNKGSELSSKAWWNAVQIHYKTGDLMGGAVASEQYYDQFPGTKNALISLQKAAESYEAMGQLEKAGDVLVKLARIESKDAFKWNSLAADFYLLANENVKAKKLFSELKNSGDTASRSSTIEKLMTIEKASGNTAAYKDLLQLVAKSGLQPQASLAQVELLEDQVKQGKAPDAFNDAKKIVGSSSASSFAKSRARFIQAQILEEEFTKQSVKARAEKIATVLAIKTEKLEKAQQAYQQAIKYGDPNVTVQSLGRLASCYAHFVESLKNMPAPSGFSEDDIAAFKTELSNLSIPLEEKTIEALQEGIRAARKFKISGPAVIAMEDSLKKMNMPLPPQTESGLIQPSMHVPQWIGAQL